MISSKRTVLVLIVSALLTAGEAKFADTTTYDGVTYNYNQYLYFGGESGL